MAFLCSGGEEVISGGDLPPRLPVRSDPNIVLPEERDPIRDKLAAVHAGQQVDPSATYGDSSDTLLHLAAQYGDIEVAARLLRLQPDLAAARNIANETPLYAACSYGHAGIATLLLQHGADRNARSIHNETPLFGACYRGHGPAIRVLFAHPGVPCLADVRSEDGLLALEVALARGNMAAYVTLRAQANWRVTRTLYQGPFAALPISIVKRIVYYVYVSR